MCSIGTSMAYFATELAFYYNVGLVLTELYEAEWRRDEIKRYI